MSYRFTHLKRTKRGSKWPNGEARQCSRCKVERRRTRPVVVTGVMVYLGSKTKMPFAYCEEHDITKDVVGGGTLDVFEEDEPVEDVIEAFDKGEKGLTGEKE